MYVKNHLDELEKLPDSWRMHDQYQESDAYAQSDRLWREWCEKEDGAENVNR